MGFNEDNKLACKKELHDSFDVFYKKKFGKNIKIHRFDKNKRCQMIFGTDVVVELENGIKLSIDEKIRRYKFKDYSTYPIELLSNSKPNYEKKGWLYTCLAQYICFGTANKDENSIIDVFMFPLSWALKNSILRNKKNYKQVLVNNGKYNQTIVAVISKIELIKLCGEDNCYQATLEEVREK